MGIFELQGKLNIDKNKKTIIFVDKGDQELYTNTYGTARFIKEKLKNQYNIITIGSSCGLKDNYYNFNGGFSDILLRKKEGPENYLELNKKTIDEQLHEDFKDLPVAEHIVLGTDFGYRLPSTGYCSPKFNKELCELKHEYFDYVGDDKDFISDIEEVNKGIIERVSPIAFSTKVSYYFNYMIEIIHKSGRLRKDVIGFVIDPAFISVFFKDKGIPIKMCYFEEDKRGTRDFTKFDIAQFQHLLYDEEFSAGGLDEWDMDDEDEDLEKTHNMFFAGTIFHETGFRATVWPTFLKDVQSDKCSYYIPLVKNNFTKSTKKHTDYLEENRKEFLDEVTLHDNYKPGITSLDLYKQIGKFKYSIVFRCVSHYDSLNFKPVFYTSKNILPFIDENYDPNFLQIPEHIQKKLIVSNSKDIDDRIKYFNDNESEREEILKELRELFRIDRYINQKDDIIYSEINKIIEYKG